MRRYCHHQIIISRLYDHLFLKEKVINAPVEPIVHLVVKQNGDNFFLYEKCKNTILIPLETDQVRPVDERLVMHFNGISDKIELDVEGNDLRELKELDTGSLTIDFRVFSIPSRGGIAPILGYGSRDYNNKGIDANNKGFMIEAGHDPLINGSKSLFYTVYAKDKIVDTPFGKSEIPSFCYDTREHLPINQWHTFTVVVSDKGTTGYLNGKELKDRKMNFGKKEDIAFFGAARSHEILKLGHGYWFGKEQFLDGEIAKIKIYENPIYLK